MGSDKGSNKRSCGQKMCCILTTLSVLAIAGTLAWYFVFFAKDVEDTVANCGGCYCVPDNTTSFACPSSSSSENGASAVPPPATSSYPEETHLNVWKSQTILNPYLLNCNPYEDGVFCDTEPPLDPDFRWAKLGETSVCAVHYEQEEPEQRERERQRYQRRRRQQQQQQSEIEVDVGESNQTETTAATEDGTDAPIAPPTTTSSTCENSAYYSIKTYPSRSDAETAGGFVSHIGNCGVCSTLQDLAVYANIDFVGVTSPGNFCRRQAATSFENGLACYRGLGMTQDCAKMWAVTSWNTAKKCFGSCVLNPTLPLPQFGGDSGNDIDTNSTESETSSEKWYDLPATLKNRFFSSSSSSDTNGTETESSSVPSNGPAPECALNDCIICNDEVSAPTFDMFAGRSRRRSGLLSTAARPCGSIPNIVQDPCPTTQPLVE